MPRIRSIKPEFYSSGKQLRVSIEAAFLLPCLWTHADDEGRFPDDDLEIGARCPRLFGKVAPLLDELTTAGWLIRYEVGGKKYIQIHDFRVHQKISKPSRSLIPPPPGTLPEPSGNTPRGSDLILSDLKGSDLREGSGEGRPGPLNWPGLPKKDTRAEKERQLRALKAQGDL